MIEARLILDPPLAGAWNMAADEALLESADESTPLTFRFYRWSEPTLSLGYFQSIHDRSAAPESAACPVVRRSSGGGAILHDRELTYSLAAWAPALSQANAAALYLQVHRALIAALSRWNVMACRFEEFPAAGEAAPAAAEPFLCFERRMAGDVVVRDERGAIPHAKIAGSAQRRRGQAILQHGSLLLARSPSAPSLPGIREATNVEISAEHVLLAWLETLAAEFDLVWRSAELTGDEQELARRLAAEKYGHPSWTCRR